MTAVLAMVLRVEEERLAYFYLPEEKKEIAFEIDNALVSEFSDALAEEESYFVMIDRVKQEVV